MMLMIKAIVDYRIGQVLRIEELFVAIGNDRGLWCHAHAFENLFVGRIDFAITIHLITKNIGKDKCNWRDVRSNDSNVGLIDFQDSQAFLLWLGRGNKSRDNSLLHVRSGRVGQDIMVFFAQNADAQGSRQGLAIGSSNDNQIIFFGK